MMRPQVGGMVQQPLPLVWSATPQRGGTRSELAEEWANCLHNLYRLEGPQCLIEEEKIRTAPQVRALAT